MDHSFLVLHLAVRAIPPCFRPSAGGSEQYLDDLHSFDPATMTWAPLSDAMSGPRPSARGWHGFTSAGGKLYVHGGQDKSGASGRPCLSHLHAAVCRARGHR